MIEAFTMKRRSYKAELAEAEKQIDDLEKRLHVASSFCVIRKCRACPGYYADGYVCYCGEDNSV